MRLSGVRIALIITLIGLSGCYMPSPAVEGSFERTLNVTGPVDLDVSTGSGSIDVRVGVSGVVRIHGLIKARNDMRAGAEEKVRYLEANPPIDANGNIVRIGRIEDPAYQNNVSISYEIETPPDTRLAARTGSGSQKIDGLHGSVNANCGSGSIFVANTEGDVNVRTGSGSIKLHGTTGRSELQTGSGSIRAQGIAGSTKASTGSGHIALEQRAAERGAPADVEAQTGSGGIELSGVFGSLRARTGSGGIRASGNPVRDWDIHAASGSVTLELAQDAAFDLHANTGSGSISVGPPVEVQGTVGRKDLRGKVRGGGSLVEVRTGSGSITIH
jgi:DUF4097 and DUF4098 domain-containing protein YvlB